MTDHSAPAPTHATTVRQRILHGLGANAFGQLVTVIVQLAGVPILLHAWGVQLYGEWLILFAIPAYLSMTDLGFSQSAGNDMTARVARGDRAGALAVFQSLGVLIYGLTAMSLALSALVVFHLPIQEWLNFQSLDANSTRWTLWLLSATVLVSLPDGVTHTGFRAGGEYALHFGMHSAVRLLQFAGVWIVALAGGGPVAAAAVFLAVRAAGTLVFAVMIVRRHPWLRYGFRQAKVAELRRLFRPALANMAIPLAQALNIQGMVVAVGAVLGPVAVVVFSTLRTLTRLAAQMVMIVANAMEPELATAHGAGNRELLRHLFVHALRAGLWLALLAAAALALFGGRVLELWTHGRVPMDGALFGWLLASAVASVLWLGGLTVLKAANRHLRAAAVYVFASAAAVGLAVALLYWTGELALVGVVLLAMDAAMALYTIGTATHLVGERSWPLLLRVMDPRPITALVYSRFSFWRQHHQSS